MSTPTRPSLASFWRDLPHEGRLLLSVVVLQFLGTGLILPFNVVYLNEVRDFPLSTAGLLLGITPLAGFLAVGPGGSAIDRYGARRILLGALVLDIVGDVLLALSSSELGAALALGLTGIAFGTSFPAFQSLIAAVIPTDQRQRYYGVNFTLLNLGVGVGGVVGGLFLNVDRLITFQAIYLLDALSFAPALFLLAVPLRHVAGRPVKDHSIVAEPASYLAVLRRPAVGSLILLGFAAAFVGYAQLNAGLPAYARAVGEVSTRGLGLAFAANTLVIVVLQLFVLQRIEGRRRTRVIALMGVIWAVSWVFLGASGLVPGTLGATVLVAACASVFGLGETLLQPTIPAIVNDLAPDHLRGRYNALSAASFQLPSVIAPPVAGFLIGHGLSGVYVAMLVVGSLAVGAISLLRLEPQLEPWANGVRASEPDRAVHSSPRA